MKLHDHVIVHALAASTLLLSAFVSPAQEASNVYPIDLPSALRLAKAQNFQIALAEERIAAAAAEHLAAKTRLLPTLTLGTSYHRHTGPLQETNGNILDVTRASGFRGLGAGATGAGTPQIPGISLSTNLAAAFLEPLIARQNVRAAEAASRAHTNRVLAEVAEAYYELVRAKAAATIAGETHANASELAGITRKFAASGEGLESDAARASVEELVRVRELEAAKENLALQSVRLAELLHLDVEVRLEPGGETVIPITVIPPERTAGELVRMALEAHPELEHSKALLEASASAMRQSRLKPLLPNISLNASAGGFAGDTGSSLERYSRRTDFNAMVYWQFDNLGFGDKARTQRRRSEHRQAELTHLETADRIKAGVARAYAKIQARERQLEIGGTAVERALTSFALNRTRIFERQGLPMEALQSVHSLSVARLLYLDSVIDYNQAQFELLAALGNTPLDAAEALAKP